MNNNINNKLIDFYINNGTDHKGRTFEDLINKNNLFLEYNHDYIQWLFPLNIKSNSNNSAPVLDQNSINVLLDNKIFQLRIIKALECMLKFYGLHLAEDENKKPKIIIKTGNLKDSFKKRSKYWIKNNNHNYKRITRILKSLKLFFLFNYAAAFFDCLKEIYKNNKDKISKETYNYWVDAVGILSIQSDIENIFKKYDISPKYISGCNFPDVSIFEGFFRFCGNPILFSARDLYKINSNLDENIIHNYDFLYDLIEGQHNSSFQNNEYRNKISQTYQNIVKNELKYGLIRIPFNTKCYDGKAVCDSYYGDYKRHYSPYVISIYEKDDIYNVNKIVDIFTDIFLNLEHYDIAKIQLNKEIKEEDIPLIYKAIRETIELINIYYIEEFERNKNNEEYQHRDDWDPENF